MTFLFTLAYAAVMSNKAGNKHRMAAATLGHKEGVPYTTKARRDCGRRAIARFVSKFKGKNLKGHIVYKLG